MIDTAALRAVMPKLSLQAAQGYIVPLNATLSEFCINSPARRAAFLAQLAHESAQLTHWSENLNYSADGLVAVWPTRFKGTEGRKLAERLARKPEAIANYVYAGRGGNGPPETGDGWKYRGRGPMQLTLRSNYARAAHDLKLPLLDEPQRVATPEVGFRVAGLFWSKWNNLNSLADLDTPGSFTTITRKINGGLNGLPDRFAYWKRAKEALAA